MTVLLPTLPYALDALEPHLSRRTLGAHHGRHHLAYVEKSRKLVKGTPLEAASLDDIVRTSAAQTDLGLFNASAQAWNHAFYWRSMRPDGGGEADGAIAGLIENSFGGQSVFRQAFVAAASDHFGSGWVWLVLDGERLQIVATPNAQTPLVSASVPLLVIDVWEHAYYLDYQHRRLDYISAFMAHLVNWEFANVNLAAALKVPGVSSRWKAAARSAAAAMPPPRSKAK